MDGYRAFWTLLVAAGLVALSGATCPNQLVQQYAAPIPRALPPQPSLEQIIQVVNQNSAQIQSFATNQATLTGPGFPALRASVAMERPRRFRLRAGTDLSGPEVDLGSNDDLFWFWIRRNEPPALYYCRHDQLASCPAQRTIPISPDWLVEALGITEFDPALPHQGPMARNDGCFEVRTLRETAQGPTTKVTVVDPVYGWIMEQSVYDSQSRLLARAVASGHRRDPLTGLTMPGAVDIQCPSAQFAMRINLGNVEINRPSPSQGAVFAMPRYEGYPTVDLCNLNPPLTPSGPAPGLSRRNRAAAGAYGTRY